MTHSLGAQSLLPTVGQVLNMHRIICKKAHREGGRVMVTYARSARNNHRPECGEALGIGQEEQCLG